MNLKNIISSLICISFLLIHVKTGFAGQKGQAVTSVSIGTYHSTDGTDTVNGTQLAVSYKYYFHDNWAAIGRLSNSYGRTQRTLNSESIELTANTTTLSGGAQFSYDFDLYSDKASDLSPYIGGGIAIQRYEYDFDYPGSDIGTTSGIGYGPFFLTGIKISLARRIVLIPGYYYEQIGIETEDGDSKSIISSGFTLALVARF